MPVMPGIVCAEDRDVPGGEGDFQGFYNRRRAQQEAFERKPARDAAAFKAKQAAEMEEFKQKLEALAHSMKPAGKTVRPKGIAAMFT